MNPAETPNHNWSDVPPTGRLLRPAEVCKRVGLSRSQVYDLIRRGAFPPFIKLSPGTSAMPETWLDEFVHAKARDAIDVGDPASTFWRAAFV